MNLENCKLREKFNHIVMKSHRGVASSLLKERLKLPPWDLYLSRLSSLKKIYFIFVIWAATLETAWLTEFSPLQDCEQKLIPKPEEGIELGTRYPRGN